jgi:hypothetical protein
MKFLSDTDGLIKIYPVRRVLVIQGTKSCVKRRGIMLNYEKELTT